MGASVNLAVVSVERSGAHRRSLDGLIVAFAVLVAVGYLWWRPWSADLPAHLARTALVRRVGNVSWWTGWFGGLSLPSYSVLAPWWMSFVGVRTAGALAAVGGAWAGTLLSRGAPRPRAGAVVFAIAGFADLLVGRVTFAVGFAIAAWALVALRARRPRLTLLAAVAAFSASPLAGLFLGLVLTAIAVHERSVRRGAAVTAGALAGAGGLMAVLFPSTGVMPMRASDMLPPALGCLAVAVLCPQRVVRTAALLTLTAIPLLLVFPGAIGGNIARLPWICAAPVVAACAPVPRRWLVVAVAAVAAWPLDDVARQVVWVNRPSDHAAYYRPLEAALATSRSGLAPSAIGERLEVTDTVDHAASAQLVSSVQLARGWDRQADNADNPIFYEPGALTAASYHSWLHSLAVGWIAIPRTALDYAARDEADLVRKGQPYLRLLWSDRNWQLYRVLDATPLATGAAVSSVTPSGVTLTSAGPALIQLRVRWSRYLRLTDARTGESAHACLSDAGGWTEIYVPHAGTYTVISRFDVRAQFRAADLDCGQDAPTG